MATSNSTPIYTTPWGTIASGRRKPYGVFGQGLFRMSEQTFLGWLSDDAYAPLPDIPEAIMGNRRTRPIGIVHVGRDAR